MAERARPPTIYDVARAAGVAASTVSRAFSRPGRVNSETAERIRRVAEQLGYRANPMARALLTGRTSMLAVVISDITNPFYFALIRGAQEEAATAGYTILLVDAQESDVLEREAIERVLPTVDGVVLASTRMTDTSIRMIAKQRPMVVLNREVRDVPSVITDIPRGMRRAAEHLGELGHDTITYVSGPDASWTDSMRWRQLHEASLELSLKVRRTGPYPPVVAGGVRAAEDLLAQATPPTAVITYNDLIAIGLVRGLQARGVVVPRDVSVVGNDNIFGADLVTPALTTVAAPVRSLGALAVRNVVALLGGAASSAAGAVVVPTRLVVRASTAQRSRKRTSPAFGTTKTSGSASSAARSTDAGSR